MPEFINRSSVSFHDLSNNKAFTKIGCHGRAARSDQNVTSVFVLLDHEGEDIIKSYIAFVNEKDAKAKYSALGVRCPATLQNPHFLQKALRWGVQSQQLKFVRVTQKTNKLVKLKQLREN
jgi:hypothetical protein